MWPLRKVPEAFDAFGAYHKFYAIGVIILTFVFALGAVAAFKEIPIEYFFYLFYGGSEDIKEDHIILLELAKRYSFNQHYFWFLFSLWSDEIRKFDIKVDLFSFLILGALLLWHIRAYKRLFFDYGLAPYYIRPENVKKRLFRRICRHVKNDPVRNGIKIFIGVIVVLLLFTKPIILVFILFIPIFIGNGLFDSHVFNNALLINFFVKLTLPYWIIYSSLALPITWKIIKEAKFVRRLNSFSRPSARWGGIGTYLTHDLNFLMKENKKEFYQSPFWDKPIYFGSTTLKSDPSIKERAFGTNNTNHILTVAQTGAGKSRDVLHNNLLLWPQGLFVLDPKGEHAARAAKERKKMGFPVHVLDPYGLCKRYGIETAGLNLLAEINIHSPTAADDLLIIAFGCIPPDDVETGNAKHFRETAQMLFAGLCAYVLASPDISDDDRNICTVFDLYLCGKPDGTLLNRDGFYKVLGEMAGMTVAGGIAMQAVKMLLDIKEGERGSIFSTFMRSVAWTKSPALRATLKKSTFTLDDIKSKKASVFVVLPFSYMKGQARWIRSLIGLAFKAAEFPREEFDGKTVSLFILDEFLQLETCKPIKDAFVTLRGAGVKMWMLVQGLDYISDHYSNYDIMISACDKQFFGTDSPFDCGYIEKMLGRAQRIYREGDKANPRITRETDELLSSDSAAEMIAKDSEPGEGYQIVKLVDSLSVGLNLVPCFWNFKSSRFGEYEHAAINYDAMSFNDEELEKLSPEEVVDLLQGKSTDNHNKTPFGFNKGAKGPLRVSIDELKDEIAEMKKKLSELESN